MYIHVCVYTYIYNTISTYYIYIYLCIHTLLYIKLRTAFVYIHSHTHVWTPTAAHKAPRSCRRRPRERKPSRWCRTRCGFSEGHENQDLVQTGGIRESNILDLVQFYVDLMEEEVFEMTRLRLNNDVVMPHLWPF